MPSFGMWPIGCRRPLSRAALVAVANRVPEVALHLLNTHLESTHPVGAVEATPVDRACGQTRVGTARHWPVVRLAGARGIDERSGGMAEFIRLKSVPKRNEDTVTMHGDPIGRHHNSLTKQ